TRNGIATNVCASTTAAWVNGTLIPTRSRAWPSQPLRPNRYSSAIPPTRGGSTSGRVTSVRSTAASPAGARESTNAIGTPSSRQHTTATAPVRKDRPRANSASGEVIAAGKVDHSTRGNRARSGSTRVATAITASASTHTGNRPRTSARPPGRVRPAVDGWLVRTPVVMASARLWHPEAVSEQHLRPVLGAHQVDQLLAELGALERHDRIGADHVGCLGRHHWLQLIGAGGDVRGIHQRGVHLPRDHPFGGGGDVLLQAH